ncbi:hypothetical protein MJ904_24770 [Massilia sp. MB5]|uniref:hypothetical protein n=1 Tax=unclassified Massilia TaxID=2609279 RepID=UPI00067DF32B|nr:MULTISPECIES: hypothetical protein [unclassified Massilia]AKU20390.1 hypothetical protein ACZ75_01455 [Massilia sp. NR 4-1]UMR30176.1 hypothetical protein MJ904_24770 [Massilia sp. MB5]
MELHLHSHRWISRQPDWLAASIAGFGAGGVMMLVELLWSSLSGGNPWVTTRMVAAMAMGWEVLQTSGYALDVVIVALVVHYVLGVVFAMMLAALIAPFQLDSSTGMVLLAGAVFGVVLYVLNFYGMSGAFSWFAEMRGWPTVVTHIIYGMAAAYIYRKLERPDKQV